MKDLKSWSADDFYHAHFGELVAIAARDFKIPLAVAERLAHEVVVMVIV